VGVSKPLVGPKYSDGGEHSTMAAGDPGRGEDEERTGKNAGGARKKATGGGGGENTGVNLPQGEKERPDTVPEKKSQRGATEGEGDGKWRPRTADQGLQNVGESKKRGRYNVDGDPGRKQGGGGNTGRRSFLAKSRRQHEQASPPNFKRARRGGGEVGRGCPQGWSKKKVVR